MVREGRSPPKSDKGWEWGSKAYSDSTLATPLSEEVQVLISILQYLKTVTNQAPQVIQTNQEEPPEAAEIQWEAVAKSPTHIEYQG